jgi:hypothetical protein
MYAGVGAVCHQFVIGRIILDDIAAVSSRIEQPKHRYVLYGLSLP